MSDDTIKIVQGLIDISNALIQRVDKLEESARRYERDLNRTVTQLYHLGLRVREIDQPAPALRRYVSTDN